MADDRRQSGLQHVTHAPTSPLDCRPAIVGGAMVMRRARATLNFRSPSIAMSADVRAAVLRMPPLIGTSQKVSDKVSAVPSLKMKRD
jgi:hypothetical protein